MTDKLIYLTDRSAVETDDKCGMRFWFNRKEQGIGIVPALQPLALAVGSATHEDLRTVAEMPDLEVPTIQAALDAIGAAVSADDRDTQAAMEILYRRLGWLAAMALYIEPDLRREYANVSTEAELILDRSPLQVAVTPDRVLRHRSRGRLVYREYKTTITAGKKWLDSWKYAIQLHIGLAAVSEELGERCAYAQIVALMKGYYSKTDHHLVHPYVWGYYNKATDQWTHEYDKARSAAWTPMPVWEYPGGVIEWVQRCGEDVARAQFPATEPVFYNERMLNDWVARRIYREKILAETLEVCYSDESQRNLFYERRQGQCKPPFGDACPYLSACWNAEIGRDPLRNGEYVTRTPHHEVEILGVEE